MPLQNTIGSGSYTVNVTSHLSWVFFCSVVFSRIFCARMKIKCYTAVGRHRHQDDKALTFDRTLITGVSFDPHFFSPFFNDRNSVMIKIGIVMLTLFMVQGAVNAFIMDQSSIY